MKSKIIENSDLIACGRMPFSGTIMKKQFGVLKRKTIGLLRMLNYPVASVIHGVYSFTFKKTFEDYVFLELFSQGGSKYTVDWSLQIGERKYGPYRAHGVNRKQIPLPKVIIDPFEVVQITVTYTILEAQPKNSAVAAPGDLVVTHLSQIKDESEMENYAEIFVIE